MSPEPAFNHESLASLAKRIDGLCSRIREALISSKADVPWDAFNHEFERFDLWADNLGLYHQGHSSLDWRLRDAESLSDFVRNLLTDMCAMIENLLILYDPSASNNNSHTGGLAEEPFDEDDSYSEDSGPDTEANTLLAEFVNINDNLYKFATKIRNPKTRQLSSKALKFSNIDPDTGVDLFKASEVADHDHVLELVRQYRSSNLGKWRDASMRLLLTESERNLISRLAKANTRRRQQFGYWWKHYSKKQAETSRARNFATGKTEASRPTTATYLMNPTAIRVDEDMASTVGGRSVAPEPINIKYDGGQASSLNNGQDDEFDLPEPPKSLKDSLCPYCFTICRPSTLSSRRSWRDHVLRDLRPFICTYGGCEEESNLFDNWRDWAKHEQWYHNRILRCPDHSEEEFHSAEGFKEHMQQSHPSSDVMLDEAMSASAEVLTDPGRPCPLCLCTRETMDALQRHIATHLQRIARFSLPSLTTASDEDSNGNFGSANAALDDSSNSGLADLESLHWSDSQRSDIASELQQPREVVLEAAKPAELELHEDSEESEYGSEETYSDLREDGVARTEAGHPSRADDSPDVPDILVLKHRGNTYPLHFPAYSIGEGVLRVGQLRRYAADKVNTADPRRIKLLYKGKILKDDALACREEGLKHNSELMCVISESLVALEERSPRRFMNGDEVRMRRSSSELFKFDMTVTGYEWNSGWEGWDYTLKENNAQGLAWPGRVKETNLRRETKVYNLNKMDRQY